MALLLRELQIDDKESALAAHAEFPDWQFLNFYTEGMDWAEFVEENKRASQGIDLAKGRVRHTFLLAEVDGMLVGRSSIRHELNTYLKNYGGHIGYGVRPEFRGRGYAKEILRQSLGYIRRLGVSEVLVTCFDENVASARVIESCGGELENIVELDGKALRRYWIRQLQR
jgi:predicted acetyltransferase